MQNHSSRSTRSASMPEANSAQQCNNNKFGNGKGRKTIEEVNRTIEEDVDRIMVLDHISLKGIKAQLSKYPKPKIPTLFAIDVVLSTIHLNIWLIFIRKRKRLKRRKLILLIRPHLMH